MNKINDIYKDRPDIMWIAPLMNVFRGRCL
jgi:hypothetical protein